MADYVLETKTDHYNFNYDVNLLLAGAPQLCQKLALSAETDYRTLSSWFAKAQFDPIDVYADVGANGASNTPWPNRKIAFDAGPIPPGTNLQGSDFCRMMLNSEADEVFMDAFGFWNKADSTGEGLSRALAETISPNSIMTSSNLSPASFWLSGPRFNWVAQPENTDQDYNSIGCSVLFLYFLRYQLGRRWEDIIQSAESFPGFFQIASIPLSLDFVFHWLTQSFVPWTGPTGVGFQQFMSVINANFPPAGPVILPNNNPFPLIGNGSWKAWGSLGAPPPNLLKGATPAISSYLPLLVDCFAVGTDHAVWHNAFDGAAWGGWKSRGGNFANGVAALAVSRGRVLFFAIAADGSLQQNRVSSFGFFETVSGWKVINAGKAVGVPTIVSWAPYRVDCFARSGQGTLLHCYSEDEGFTYTAWQDLGNPGAGISVAGSPAAVTQRPDSIDCFVRGSDQIIHQLTWDGFTWNWHLLAGVGAPGQVTGDPAVVVRGPNLIDLFVEVATEVIAHFRFNPGRNSWQPLVVGHPGDMQNDGPPAAASPSPDRVELVVIASDPATTNVWRRVFTVP